MTTSSSSDFPSGFTIYEIPARPYLYSLSSQPQPLSSVPDTALDTLASRGVHMVWLQGVWRLGTYGLEQVDKVESGRLKSYREALVDFRMEDVIGSPYAVFEYTVNPELGGDEALKEFRKRLKQRGIKLMLDFVPNHVAVDSVWATQPDTQDYFVRKPSDTSIGRGIEFDSQGRAYGRDLYSGAWIDTLQLNYWNPRLRTAMMNALLKAASLCDGLRVDMAMLSVNSVIEQVWGPIHRANGYTAPQTEFWLEAIQRLRSAYPSFYLMAEVYDWPNFNPPLDVQLQTMGFDATYAKALYDRLVNPHLDNLRSTLGADGMKMVRHVHFVENHDEVRAPVHFGGYEQAMAGAVASLTLPGPRLMWFGQWEGKRNRLLVQLRRSYPEPIHAPTQSLYNTLVPLLAHPTMTHGTWTLETVVPEQSNTGWRLVAWKWTYSDRRLVVVNLSDTYGDGRIKLPEVTGSGGVEVLEALSGVTYQRDREELRNKGLWVVLKPWQTQMFVY
ncbi:amylase [Spizellomyces punctatus DAOM BR117]|uniref:Amylase n=1 Tax=Spizellomyces punctatus (strain DAOM BR117) TaxID=645134 RepID=A0A0L0H784_SPIPD|nr:amylase [Spizellomyces punctatus DAOM BR117]KNC97400.1 amylase [Spizellomyces punctatus DAOM BR117]|eukprot:XP_016605440.1 amylase [Spizellomyces punctatus DAOM BR117]